MALYTGASKDRVRDAVDFVELVSARTDLRRAGPARYEGLCPFHEERTPSLGIVPTQNVY
jgi:DNA primase